MSQFKARTEFEKKFGKLGLSSTRGALAMRESRKKQCSRKTLFRAVSFSR